MKKLILSIYSADFVGNFCGSILDQSVFDSIQFKIKISYKTSKGLWWTSEDLQRMKERTEGCLGVRLELGLGQVMLGRVKPLKTELLCFGLKWLLLKVWIFAILAYCNPLS